MNKKYPYKNLTYQIIGLIYDTYNELGYGYQEKYYQRSFELLLKDNNINYDRELKIPIKFKEKIIGRYFIDFVIEKKIALEFKIAEDYYLQHKQQLLAYLRSANIKIGLLILFTKKGIKIKRFIN